MSDKSAIIKIHYYLVNVSDLNSSDSSFKADADKKLNDLLDRLVNVDVRNLVWEPNNNMHNSIVLQNVSKDSNGFWKLNFIKVRDEAMPGKINSDGVFTEIPLEENEYIGEDMTMLYSPEKKVIAVQRNYYSVSASKIEDYFNQMLIQYQIGDLTFKFEPIIDTSEHQMDNAIIRSISVSCLDLSGDGIKAAVRNDDIFGAGRISITYGVGTQKKKASLDKKILNWLRYFVGDKRFTKLQVGYKEDENSPVSVIDYINNKIEDCISIRYSKQNPITHEKLYLGILPKFKDLINNKL